MKLQAASVLELVSELLLRFDAQGKPELIGGDVTFNEILEEFAIDKLELFNRLHLHGASARALPTPKKGK